MAPCAIALQKLLDICHEYGVEHDVTYNPLKYVCIVSKPERFSLKYPLVQLGNNVLDYQEKVKYLGVLLNDTLNDNDYYETDASRICAEVCNIMFVRTTQY